MYIYIYIYTHVCIHNVYTHVSYCCMPDELRDLTTIAILCYAVHVFVRLELKCHSHGDGNWFS